MPASIHRRSELIVAIIVGIIVGLVVILALGARGSLAARRRRGSRPPAPWRRRIGETGEAARDRELDSEAVDRAAGEGMATAIGASVAARSAPAGVTRSRLSSARHAEARPVRR